MEHLNLKKRALLPPSFKFFNIRCLCGDVTMRSVDWSVFETED